MTPRILAFAGSARQDSWNKRLVRAASMGARRAGAEVSLIDLRDFPLPLFDEDLERDEGPPANLAPLKRLFVEHHGLLLSCPEYNSSITPLLKNTIDWLSRRQGDEPPRIAFRGKAAGLLSASTGALGGLRGLVHVRAILGNIGVLVIPEQFALSQAHEAFDAEGGLKEERQRASAEGVGEALASLVLRL